MFLLKRMADNKELVYASLVDLTRNTDEERYFSPRAVLNHGRGDADKEGIWDGQIPDEQIPGHREVSISLDVLAAEGKSRRVISQTTAHLYGEKVRIRQDKLYRAILNK